MLASKVVLGEADAVDTLVFDEYRSGAGMTPRPLRRIASGGELSRVMLASKVVLGEADAVDTLVFDEVDAGVGGSTARSLAQVLADLARTHQVIVVTHLAQVAVQGSVHYVVRRDDAADIPETSLIRVEAADRIALARTHQVIVVTHLAQVAVQGSVHYVVRRDDAADIPETSLIRVEAADRIAEIARLLSSNSSPKQEGSNCSPSGNV